jgi:hypothetical protein
MDLQYLNWTKNVRRSDGAWAYGVADLRYESSFMEFLNLRFKLTFG